MVQVLTHGIGFDRSYWNLPFNDFNYSYTNTAVDTFGFATLSYDRLGIGASQHGDPLNIVQSWLQMAALEALSTMLRAGSIPGVPKFNKVLHVGHSFGSIQTVGVLRTRPDIWDGVALTGFSPRSEFLRFFELAADFEEANPVAPEFPLGYLAPGGTAALQEALVAPNQFEPDLLQFLASTGQPPTVGEFLTLDIRGCCKRSSPRLHRSRHRGHRAIRPPFLRRELHAAFRRVSKPPRRRTETICPREHLPDRDW